MPRRDKTGPEGFGPITGRRMGNCVGNNNSGFYENRGRGEGFGRRMKNGLRGFNQGFGRGLRQNYRFSITPETSDKDMIEREISFLKSKMEHLESELKKLD